MENSIQSKCDFEIRYQNDRLNRTGECSHVLLMRLWQSPTISLEMLLFSSLFV